MALKLWNRESNRGRADSESIPSGVELIDDLVLAKDSPYLGAILLAHGHIDTVQLNTALEFQASSGLRIGEQLLHDRAIDEGSLAEALSDQFAVHLIDLTVFDVMAEATAIVDEDVARSLGILPISIAEDEALVVVSDPGDPRVLEALKGLRVGRARVGVAPKSQIANAVNLAYRPIGEVEQYVDRFATTEQSRAAATKAESDEELELQADAPVVQVVNRIVTQALRDRASDVHIEPMDKNVRVRFRVDGALKEILRLPTAMGPALISRIKIMAEMNIVERRRPQDGQFQTKVDGVELDVRVSTTSTIFGEKAVLRLLDKSRAMINLSDLGMPAHTGKLYSKMVRAPARHGCRMWTYG
jgi:type IV pilus assembly protein PilB